MTTRGIWSALALALVVSLGTVATADASSRLTRKEAKRMAVRLGHKQVRKFDLRFYQLGKPRRTGRRGIAFPYAARTHANTYCTATLRVRKRVHGRRIVYTARIGRQHCRPMPADALAIESASRKASRAFRRRATSRSLLRYFGRMFSCADMNIPRRREAAVEAIFSIGLIHSIFDPNRAMFEKFAARLDAVETTHVVLADGVAGWIDFVDVVESLPRFRYPCAAIRRWKRNGWESSEAPVDLREFRADVRRLDSEGRAIDRAGRFLRRVGVYPKLATAFVNGGIGDVFDEDDIETAEIGSANAHLPLIPK